MNVPWMQAVCRFLSVEKKHLEQEARTLMERCPESPFLYSGVRCAYTITDTTDQRHALRHAAAKR